MICHNCQATVDNDLVFCTSCGARLYETMPDVPTVAMTGSIVTQTSANPVKKYSPLKWIALIIALIALPVSLGIAYLLTRNQPAAVVTNANKPAAVNRKTNTNTVNKNLNVTATNTTIENSAAENVNGDNMSQTPDPIDEKAETIFDEQIEIASGEHVAYPFKADSNVKVFGKFETLRGEPVTGYFYIQNVYDEYFPDPIYKVSSFKEKSPEIRQYLVAGDYVLVFLNENKSSTVIKGKLEIEPNE